MSRRRKVDPRDLLDDVLLLMEADIEQITQMSQQGKLDPDAANCLVRYSDSLLKMVKNSDDEEDAMKKKLAKMSTEELAQMAEQMAAKAKGQ